MLGGDLSYLLRTYSEPTVKLWQIEIKIHLLKSIEIDWIALWLAISGYNELN